MNLLVKIIVCSYLTGICFLLSCNRELSCETCQADNKPPIANAGPDQVAILPKDSISLDGHGSKDPDGTIIKFSWSKISGPSSYKIDSALSASTKVTKLDTGTYHFVLEVTDNGLLSSKDTVTVIVDKVKINHPPVANAGEDISIILPSDTVLLDGSGSTDIDNNIASYAWTKIAGPSTVNISDPIANQTKVSQLLHGVYLFELVVTDKDGLYDKDTVRVSVNKPAGVPPIANAGKDIVANYNLQTCSLDPVLLNLDGSASSDPDGTIVSYKWSLIYQDPNSVTITNPNAAVASLTQLSPGTYSFRLLVTDNNGAIDDDTVVVNTVAVNRVIVDAQLIPVGYLSAERKVSVVATVGNKIFFAGGTESGSTPGPHFSSRVDIYDVTSGTWTTAELSQARWGMTAVASGTKIFFAGGTAIQSSPLVGLTSRVDIFDASTNTWSTMELPRRGQFASIAAGNKIYFAGGNAVDIYDVSSDSWSKQVLSQPRYLITPLNVQGKLYFAGGASGISGGTPSSRIDMYDPLVNSWTISELSKPKFGMSGIGMRGKFIVAGGTSSKGMTNEVEIVEPGKETQFACLFQPNSFGYHSVGRSGNRLVFFVWDGKLKDEFDIYDISTDSWSIGKLSEPISPSLVISVNGSIYVVGSADNNNGYYNQVWKLNF